MRPKVIEPQRNLRCHWLVERPNGTRSPCCAREVFQVCVDVRSSRNAPTYRVVLPFKVCNKHRRTVTLDEILVNGSWALIQQEMRSRGKKEPRRRLAEITFERISELKKKRALAHKGPGASSLADEHRPVGCER